MLKRARNKVQSVLPIGNRGSDKDGDADLEILAKAKTDSESDSDDAEDSEPQDDVHAEADATEELDDLDDDVNADERAQGDDGATGRSSSDENGNDEGETGEQDTETGEAGDDVAEDDDYEVSDSDVRNDRQVAKRDDATTGERLEDLDQRSQSSTPADVVLDIPTVHVDEIELKVENLEANVALDVRLANLLKVSAGVDVSIDKVDLDIKGVDAEAMLVVRLEQIQKILTQTLQTLAENPEILENLAKITDVTGGSLLSTSDSAS